MLNYKQIGMKYSQQNGWLISTLQKQICNQRHWNYGHSKVAGFEDVRYVDWPKANLLSISQICDNGLNVIFTKYECKILDGGGDCMCIGEGQLTNVMV